MNLQEDWFERPLVKAVLEPVDTQVQRKEPEAHTPWFSPELAIKMIQDYLRSEAEWGAGQGKIPVVMAEVRRHIGMEPSSAQKYI